MLFGLVEVRMWLYLWGMSERQVDLLLADQPVTIYLDDDKKPGKKSKSGTGPNDMPKPSNSDVFEATRKWNEKYGNGDTKPKLDLGGFGM